MGVNVTGDACCFTTVVRTSPTHSSSSPPGRLNRRPHSCVAGTCRDLAPYGSVCRVSPTTRLSREDWILAALRAVSRQGVSGIAVEPLAKSLGTTKGSFYWHFQNRGELVMAALERWEREGTEVVIATLSPLDDARVRLRRLFEALFVTQPPQPAGGAALQVGRSGKALDLSIALTADGEGPDAAELIDRVTTRRIAWIAEQLCDLGIEAEEARRRALFAYAAYIGHSRLAHGAAGTLPQGSGGQQFVDSMLQVLTVDTGASRRSR